MAEEQLFSGHQKKGKDNWKALTCAPWTKMSRLQEVIVMMASWDIYNRTFPDSRFYVVGMCPQKEMRISRSKILRDKHVQYIRKGNIRVQTARNRLQSEWKTV